VITPTIRVRPAALSILCGLLIARAPVAAQAPDGQVGTAPPGPTAGQLGPTMHPALPSNPSDLWLVPSMTDRASRSSSTFEPLATGVKRFEDGDYDGALQLVSRPSLANTALADYASYYTGLAQLRLGRSADARRTFDAIIDRKAPGYVTIAAGLAAGEAAEAAGDFPAATRIYERIADQKAAVSEEVLSRLGRAALAAGDRAKAAQAYIRLYYEFPLTDAAVVAGQQLAALQDQFTRTSYKPDMTRAQLLFGAKRFDEARAAFAAIQLAADGDDRELVNLRVAECDFYLKRYAAARDGMMPYLERASRKAEARFFYLSALRELGDREGYVAQTAALVAEFPESSWSEEALNNLGTFYILQDEDDEAATAFKELYDRFPTGPRAERAAWKYGWDSYKKGQYAETVRVFESASIGFPRSDYRPSFLYWSGRAHSKLGHTTQAESRLRLVFTDYANSYYGRLAERQLSRGGNAAATREDIRFASHEQPPAPDVKPIPTEPLIRLLLANGLYDDALAELRYAQRAWGTSSRIDATIAWVHHQKGDLRRAISLMRRTYPQFLTAGGQELLPAEILQVIFPLAYWDSIKRYSAQHDLDPYVVAALIAQESTFDPQIKSAANAWGLMQIVPTTGRRLARAVGVRRFSIATLTNPEINIRMGTLYFSDLVRQFGGTYYALASYNAGENRVIKWKAERQGLDEDEFIDDIPFPETQNYVKRILGTAEDYRRLYGNGGTTPAAISTLSPARASAKAKAAAARTAAKKKTSAAKSTKKKTPPKPAPKKRRSR
jgi:soluble lytic murein transglycosylase